MSITPAMLCRFLIVALLILSPASRAQDNDPSKWTLLQWEAWRDSQITNILTPSDVANRTEKLINRERVITNSAKANELLSPILFKDPGFFKRDTALAQNMGNFVAFVQAQTLMTDPLHNLGFTITDQEYWSYAKSNLMFPELIKTQEFLEWMSKPTTYAQAVAAIEQHNTALPQKQQWHVLPFEAQFIKSIHDEPNGRTYGRMVILIPNTPTEDGGTLDRWILFSLATADQPDPGDIRPVSMIALRAPPTGAPGQILRQKVYFMDFIRERDPVSQQINITPTVLLKDHASKNCYDCHKSAILSIRPHFEFEFVNGVMTRKVADDGVIASRINDYILQYSDQYGIPDWGYLDPSAYGPSLGPKGLRTDEFIARATGDLNLPATSYGTVKKAMNCARCHAEFAPLNYLQAVRNNRDVSSFRRHEGMFQSNIEEGWMPPQQQGLSEVERKALWRCVMKEYFDLETNAGILVDWLKGVDSKGNSPQEIHLFNQELTSVKTPIARDAFRTPGPSSLAKAAINAASVERDLQMTKTFVEQKKYQEAEKALWESYDGLRSNGIRGQTGLSWLESITEQLRALYNIWKSPESSSGAKRLKALDESSSHGE